MDHPKITRLYKCTSFDTHAIGALMNRKLWFSLPTGFNDPFDSVIANDAAIFLTQAECELSVAQKKAQRVKFQNISTKIDEIHQNFLLPAYENRVRAGHQFIDLHNTLQNAFSKFGVLSLSATPNNILMWSHYGGQHSGLCFEFERTSKNRLGTEAKPITYSSKRTFKPESKKVASNPLFMKHIGWAYEQEWRLLENSGGALYDFPANLLAVICGARMTPEDKKTVSLIVESLNSHLSKKILVRQAEMSATTYNLKIKP